jgi:hypothetical protein
MLNDIGKYAKQHHYRIHPMKTKIIQYSTTNDEYRWYLDGKGDEQELLSFERRLLKQIQGLTDRCPTIAVYSLLGAIPITTQIEKNTLTTFYNIAANKEFVEHEIARRQLAIKDQNSNSWFTHIRKLLQKYSLPTAYNLMERPPTKGKWKAVEEHHMTEWYNKVEDKTSLKYLTLQKHPTRNSHPIWHTVPNLTTHEPS